MNELALFAGAGGGILGGKLLGWRTICAVELDAYCARRLMQRQNEKYLPPFPIWDDVCSFDGRQWEGLVDVVSGGFPCQDISEVRQGAKGLEGKQSGLWREMHRIIGECRPQYVLIENSPRLVRRGLSYILDDLAQLGYDANWGVLGACHTGAPHQRKRCWVVAFPKGKPLGAVRQSRESAFSWPPQPGSRGMDDGMANRMDRCRAIGNGQVPAVVKLAWRLLSPGL